MKTFICILAVSMASWLAAAQAATDRTALRPVKVRTGPAVFHPVIERLDAGSTLLVIEDGKRWVKVRTASGSEGWVSARVFTERPQQRGYSAVLQERGLTGVSSTVATMATKGLTVQMGRGGGALSPLVTDFLTKVPFDPGDFETFVRDLPANPICARLPGWIDELGAPLPGDPEQDEQERLLGMRLAGLVLADAVLITDEALDAYVNKVGAAVAAASSRYDLQWRFVVFEQARPEAFPAPGGFVFLSSGLLEKLEDEAELAGVLAHQVAHVSLGHGAAELDRSLGEEKATSVEERMQRLVGKAHALLRAARPDRAELAADAYGATCAACAGYDPAGLARVYERLGFFEAPGADLSSRARRIELIQKVARTAGEAEGKYFPERFRRAVLTRSDR